MRGKLLIAAALLLTALAAGAKENGDDGSYSVVILGDTHYDAKSVEVYHSDFVPDNERQGVIRRAEFERNGAMWSGRSRRLLRRASRLVTKDTRMVLQTGDLIQGDCGNPDVHRRMLDEVLGLFKSKFRGLPFITVEGNHDIRGTGAEDVYNEYMPARMSKELGQDIRKTTFGFRIGPDAYIVIDFNHPSASEIRRLLAETEDARYTFVLTHGPAFPSDDSTCRWFLYGSNRRTELRREFRREFARRGAIVLCGHTHNVELADWVGDGGRITQMTMSSVWSADSLATLHPVSEGADSYGTVRPRTVLSDGTSVNDEQAIFDEYRPGLERYFNAKGAGSFKMRVSPDGVIVDFYGGASRKVTESFVLRGERISPVEAR